jgi:acetoin utilization deacetylase AcuC-like enzyme
MIVYYSDKNTISLPRGHHFPAEKYQLLRLALIEQQLVKPNELRQAPRASKEMITLAHTEQYYDSIINGSVDQKILSRIGLPWSVELVKRSLSSVGGSIQAALVALNFGLAGNLGGGTHHAMADRGQGFCVFNDLAVASLYLLNNKLARRIAILDLDAHQGNGNSSILGKNPAMFILSLHGDKTYPFHKIPSTIDIALHEYIGDKEYLSSLNEVLPSLFDFNPDIIFYIAGVDPLQGDRYGKLGLSLAGLAQRDRLVITESKRNNIPLAMVMGGGYANPIQNTVEAHVQTYRILKDIYN